jgi:gluconolactonase
MPIIPNDRVHSFGQGIHSSEGVMVDRDGYVIGFSRDHGAYRVSPDGVTERFAELPEGTIPNGTVIDDNGDYIYCCLGRKAMMRLTPSGKVSMVADHAGGVPLLIPNFCTHDADGNLFVSVTSTKRDFSRVFEEVMNPEPNGALVVLRTNGSSELVADGLWLANGTAIDPAEEAVYVLQSGARDLVRVPLRKGGGFGKPEVYSKDFPGIPDGLAFDVEGNCYVTCIFNHKKDADGKISLVACNQIIKVDRNGCWEPLIEDHSGKIEHPSNCAFGGTDMKRLYIANMEADHFAYADLDTPGHKLRHQR